MRKSGTSGVLPPILATVSAIFLLLLLALFQAIHFHLCHSHPSWSHVFPFIPSFTNEGPQALSREDLHRILMSQERSIEYNTFDIFPPSFADASDKSLFYKNNDNIRELLPPTDDRLRGRIQVLQNASVHSEYDCGWQTDVNVYMNQGPRRKTSRKYGVICPMLVPQSNTFQHFVDGVLPKIIQSYDVLQKPNVTLVIFRPWDRIIEHMVAALNIPSDKVMFYDGGYLVADYVINTCVTPPIHPTLWQEARQRLTSQSEAKNSPEVVLLTRTRFRNPGRFIINKEEIIMLLKSKYSSVHVFEGGYNLNKSIEIFKSAKIIIGVHGGAFYNIIFAPKGAHVLEILPTEGSGGYVPNNLAYNIFWKMSSMLELDYWRISEEPRNQRGDVIVDVGKLEKILSLIT